MSLHQHKVENGDILKKSGNGIFFNFEGFNPLLHRLFITHFCTELITILVDPGVGSPNISILNTGPCIDKIKDYSYFLQLDQSKKKKNVRLSCFQLFSVSSEF